MKFHARITSVNQLFQTLITALAFLLVGSQAHAIIDITLQMQLGNPSGAIVDTNNHNNYLLQRTVDAVDFSDTLGEPT